MKSNSRKRPPSAPGGPPAGVFHIGDIVKSERRILALAEGRFSPLKSKTANGAIAYLPNQVVGVIDSTKAGLTAQQVLGYGGTIPVVQIGRAHV